MVQLRATGCCGVQEITGIAHEPSPQVIIEGFCKQALRPAASRFDYNTGQSTGPLLYAHYTFTAAVYDKDCATFERLKQDKKFDHELNLYDPYGHRLAEFIQKHGLGTVTTTEPKPNKLFHPDHKTQIWIWTPDQDMLEKLFAPNLKREKANELRRQFQEAELIRVRYEKNALDLQEKWIKAEQAIDPNFKLESVLQPKEPVVLKKRIVRKKAGASADALALA